MAAAHVNRQPRAERVPREVDRPDPEPADDGGHGIGVIGKAEIPCRVSGATAAGCVPGDDVVVMGQALQLRACLETLAWPTGCDWIVAVRGVSLRRYASAGPHDPDL